MSISVTQQLSGCTKVLTGNKQTLTGVLLALFTCEVHQGSHHFAVINEGEAIAMSDVALHCLRAQGVDLT